MENQQQGMILPPGGSDLSAQGEGTGESRRVREKLWRLLEEQVRRYTMGESSSVPVETAQELLDSIRYTVEWYLQALPPEQAEAERRREDYAPLLERGQRALEREKALVRDRYQRVTAGALPVENRSYRDTLAGLERFFRQYDHRFFAHQIPCDIDYQLCREVEGLTGVAYIGEYLNRLLLEQDFCRRFSMERVGALLRAGCPDYRELLINLYRPVAECALGLALADGEPRTLDISEGERERLLGLIRSWSAEEADLQLVRAADAVAAKLELSEQEQEYLANTAKALRPRLESAAAAGSLAGVFPSLLGEREAAPVFLYEDGERMEDSRLRRLMEELSDCTLPEERAGEALAQIHSLRDLAEVLEVCFWGAECHVLFSRLDDAGLALLGALAQGRQADRSSASRWEEELARFVEQLPLRRREEIAAQSAAAMGQTEW